jgi:colanic acid biosynthesis glycosyl transferase WcaI
LAAADVHLISLKADFAGYVLPSKLYGCLSSKRPILFVGPKCSDIHLLCDEDPTLLYRQVDNDDAGAFALALEDLADRRRRADDRERNVTSAAGAEQA